MLYIIKNLYPNILLGIVLASVIFYFVGTILAILPLLLMYISALFLSFKLLGYKLF